MWAAMEIIIFEHIKVFAKLTKLDQNIENVYMNKQKGMSMVLPATILKGELNN